jgi:glutamate-1-semialdehyde 2,1-aminomutase
MSLNETPIPGVPRADLERLLAGEQERFDASHRRSTELHAAASQHLVLGVQMPWMLAWPGSCPIQITRGEGSYLYDVDDNRYVDLCLGDTGSMTGHSPPAAVAAIRKRAGEGMTFMLPTEDGLAVGRALAERFGLPRWQFTLSATDANRHALRYARLVTGRPKVLIFDRSYHGTVDECFATLDGDAVVPREGSLGPPVSPALTTRVVPFNDLEALERELAHGDVACVITEPAMTNIGVVLPEPGFHDGLRELTRQAGTLLLIDETHTLSAGPAGWTGRHGLDPDMFVVGKAIASGVPAAALGLSDEVSAALTDRVDPARAGMGGVGGTLAGNALSLAAIRATLEEVLTPAAFERTEVLGARCEEGIATAIAKHELPWHVVRIGGRVEYHFTPEPLRNGREGTEIIEGLLSGYLHLYALNRGVMVFPFHNRCLVSPAHSEADVDLHGAVLDEALASLRPA